MIKRPKRDEDCSPTRRARSIPMAQARYRRTAEQRLLSAINPDCRTVFGQRPNLTGRHLLKHQNGMTPTKTCYQSEMASESYLSHRASIFKGGRSRQMLIELRSSFWFLPVLIVIVISGLALGLIETDRKFGEELMRWSPRWFDNDPEGARSILQAIAGSMATVAGVVFSITIVALTLASTQYSPRVLRNFMRDRLNQAMLGIFIGVFIYCLLVMRSISGDNGTFVPSLALLGALVLAIGASGTFIFFIHHIAASIQASELTKAITKETSAALDEAFPPQSLARQEKRQEPEPEMAWQPLPAQDVGYIQTVNLRALVDFACTHDTIVRMDCGVGDFVAPGWTMASIASAGPASIEMVEEINRIYAIDGYRTIDQDAAFGFRQLVDVALKALSPGINDTTTAVTCIEHLTALLSHCAPHPERAPWQLRDGVLRLIEKPHSFAYLVALAFEQIRENAKGNTEILLRLMAAIERVSGWIRGPYRLLPLQVQLQAIAETIESESRTAHERGRLQEKLAAVRTALNRGEGH